MKSVTQMSRSECMVACAINMVNSGMTKEDIDIEILEKYADVYHFLLLQDPTVSSAYWTGDILTWITQVPEEYNQQALFDILSGGAQSVVTSETSKMFLEQLDSILQQYG